MIDQLPSELPDTRVPPFTLALVVTALVFALFVSVGAPAQSLSIAWGIWFTEAFVFFGLPVIALRLTRRAPWRYTGVDQLTAAGVGLGFLLGAVNYFAWPVPLMFGAEHLFPERIVELFDSANIFKRQTPVEIAVIIAGVSLAAPLCEELFFRGVVQRGLMSRLPPSRAIVVTAFLFSVFHLDPVGFLARFEMGVLFGLLAWRAGSIWPAVAAHAANNVVSTLVFFATGMEESELAWWVPLALLVAGNVALVLVARLSAGKLAAPRPAEDVEVGPAPVGSLLTVWFGGAVIALVLLLAVDLRGVRLNLFDLQHPIPKELRDEPRLRELRAKARRGEVPLDEYFDLRKLMTERPAPQG